VGITDGVFDLVLEELPRQSGAWFRGFGIWEIMKRTWIIGDFYGHYQVSFCFSKICFET
jgi:hypothetical protein